MLIKNLKYISTQLSIDLFFVNPMQNNKFIKLCPNVKAFYLKKY